MYHLQEQDYIDFIAEMREIHPEAEVIPSDNFPIPILVYAEMNSGYIEVEGSPTLGNEILVYQGLNEKELENVYVVARYIDALKKTHHEG